MATPVQTAGRLLDALEDLVGQETVLLQAADFAAVASLQARTAAIVGELAILALDPPVWAFRPRVDAVIARRRRNTLLIDRQCASAQAGLRRIDEARSRLARVAPAYRGGSVSAPRLNTAA